MGRDRLPRPRRPTAHSTDLSDRIGRWDDAFQATRDQTFRPDSRFPDHAAEAAWRGGGDAIFVGLAEAPGPDRVTRRGPF